MQPRSKARLQLLGAAALFSTGGAAIKATAFTGFQVAGLRSAVAAIAFLVMVPSARRLPDRRELLVGVAYSGALVFFAAANKMTTAANAIFLQYTAPIYLLLLGPLLLRERVTRRDLLFLVAAAIGLALFFVDVARPLATAPDPVRGNLFGLASGVSWAATLLGMRWLGRTHGSAVGSVVAGNAIAALACVPFALPLSEPSAGDLGILFYLGVFQVGAAYVLVTSGMKEVGALEASLLMLVEPVLSPLWAWLAHGETPGAFALAGGAILLVATTVKTWRESRAESALGPGREADRADATGRPAPDRS